MSEADLQPSPPRGLRPGNKHIENLAFCSSSLLQRLHLFSQNAARTNAHVTAHWAHKRPTPEARFEKRWAYENTHTR